MWRLQKNCERHENTQTHTDRLRRYDRLRHTTSGDRDPSVALSEDSAAASLVEGPILRLLGELRSVPSGESSRSYSPRAPSPSPPPIFDDTIELENPLLTPSVDTAAVAQIAETLTDWMVNGPDLETLSDSTGPRENSRTSTVAALTE